METNRPEIKIVIFNYIKQYDDAQFDTEINF